jgi:hypothetical protein
VRALLHRLLCWLLARFVRPLPPADEIPFGALHRGDVVLKRTTDHWTSLLIMALDQGSYSHSGLFDGAQVIDSGTAGITRRELYSCDVYRFHDAAGRELDPEDLPPLPAGPIVDQAETYRKVPNRYSYTSLYLVGLLMVIGWITAPGLRLLVELFGGILLWQVHRLIDELNRKGTVEFTCSELVTQCFWQPSDDEGEPYGLRVRLEERHGRLWRAVPGRPTRYERLLDRMARALEEARPGLLEALDETRRRRRLGVGTEAIAGSPLLPAAFVSPGDLQHSPSLRLVGRYAGPG